MARNTILILAILVLVIVLAGQFVELAGAQADGDINIDSLLRNQERILQRLDDLDKKLDVIRMRVSRG